MSSSIEGPREGQQSEPSEEIKPVLRLIPYENIGQVPMMLLMTGGSFPNHSSDGVFVVVDNETITVCDCRRAFEIPVKEETQAQFVIRILKDRFCGS